MAKKISASVGKGGKNYPPDVKTIQALLNAAGATPKLDVDGKCGPKTYWAITQFQQKNLGFGDGRVDVPGKTLDALTAAYKPGAPPPPKPDNPAQVDKPEGLSPLRQKIIAIAQQQAAPPPGKVSDLVTIQDPATGKVMRKGWQQLQRFFDEAVSGWTPNHWKDPKILAGVQIPGRRIPQPEPRA